jgi:hypothetical protein
MTAKAQTGTVISLARIAAKGTILRTVCCASVFREKDIGKWTAASEY